jgi:hypothetical protein
MHYVPCDRARFTSVSTLSLAATTHVTSPWPPMLRVEHSQHIAPVRHVDEGERSVARVIGQNCDPDT